MVEVVSIYLQCFDYKEAEFPCTVGWYQMMTHYTPNMFWRLNKGFNRESRGKSQCERFIGQAVLTWATVFGNENDEAVPLLVLMWLICGEKMFWL